MNYEAPAVYAPSISSSAMLAELSISVWTGRKLDKSATRQTTDANNAEAGIGSFHKKLLGDCAELVAISKFASNVRSFHYHSTMPWSDLGMRLLPTTMYMDYMRELTAQEQEFSKLVETFLQAYSWAQMQAQVKLGALYNPDEYPTVDALTHKFKFRHAQMPVPDAGDFRLDIGAEASKAVSDQYAKHYQAMLNDAMGDVWQRTYDALSKMSERLNYESKDDKKVFRDSLVDHVHEMVGLLSKFNVTGDARMEAMRVQLDNVMAGVSADGLRESDAHRKDVKQKVDAVLNQMKW